MTARFTVPGVARASPPVVWGAWQQHREAPNDCLQAIRLNFSLGENVIWVPSYFNAELKTVHLITRHEWPFHTPWGRSEEGGGMNYEAQREASAGCLSRAGTSADGYADPGSLLSSRVIREIRVGFASKHSGDVGWAAGSRGGGAEPHGEERNGQPRSLSNSRPPIGSAGQPSTSKQRRVVRCFLYR